VVGLATCISSYAQRLPDQRWSIHVQPSAIFHPVFPAIQLGMEKGVSHFGLLVESGILLPSSVYDKSKSFLDLGDFSSHNQGVFLRVEGKYYFGRVFYASLNLQYLYNHYRRTDTFDATPELTETVPGNVFCTTCIEETYTIDKHMLGASARIGARIPLAQRFALDIFAGVGFNYHMNTHSVNEELHRNPAKADGFFSYYNIHYPGNFLYKIPSPTLAFRFAYFFGVAKT
jgi:hypothetical protein